MKIARLIRELEEMHNKHGDLEVTCTHSMIPDDHDRHLNKVVPALADAFETTVETLQIETSKPHIFGEKHIRLYL
jgi:hypothetical protein